MTVKPARLILEAWRGAPMRQAFKIVADDVDVSATGWTLKLIVWDPDGAPEDPRLELDEIAVGSTTGIQLDASGELQGDFYISTADLAGLPVVTRPESRQPQIFRIGWLVTPPGGEATYFALGDLRVFPRWGESAVAGSAAPTGGRAVLDVIKQTIALDMGGGAFVGAAQAAADGAQASAGAAAASAEAAAGSAGMAATKAGEADASAAAAAGSAATANTKAGDAAGSATAAAGSAATANTKAGDAAASATAAAGSASAASTSAGAAATSATAAAGSQSSASTSATAAAASAASAAAHDVDTHLGMMERASAYDSAVTINQAAATIRRGADHLPAANTGASYFRRGLVASTALTGVATFTRASVGHAVDQSGAVLGFASGAPCITTAGYSSEVTSTNLQTNSSDFSSASYARDVTGTGVAPAVTPNYRAGPKSGTMAQRVVFDLNGGTLTGDRSQLRSTLSGSWADGTVRTKSVWIISNTSATYGVQLRMNTASLTMLAYPDRWTRYEVAGNQADTTCWIALRGSFTDGYADVSLWEDQVEALPFATSNMPTTTVPVTRAGDTKVEAADIPVGQAFTVTGKFISPPSSTLGGAVVFDLVPASGTADRLALYYSPTTQTVSLVGSSAGVSNSALLTSAALTARAPVGYAVVVADNTVTLYVNGVLVGSATLPGGAFAQALTRLFDGCNNAGTNQLNGVIRERRLLPYVLGSAKALAVSDVSLEWDEDYTTQTYKYLDARYAAITDLPLTAFTRATAGMALTVAARLLSYASGAVRATDAGLTIEPARTKKNTNPNVNPANTTGLTTSGDAAAVLSVVDDSAALAAIGLTGNVYKLDNTAGVANAYAYLPGTTGNTNPHAFAAFVRGGSGGIAQASGTGGTSFGVSASYQRIKAEGWTPASSAAQCYVRAAAGQVVYFILSVLEEGGYCTSPISDAVGTAVTRNAETLQSIGANPAAYSVFAEFTIQASGPAYGHVWCWDDGAANNRARLFHDRAAGKLFMEVVTGGVTVASLDLGAVVAGTTYKVAAAVAANDFEAIRSGGAAQTDTSGAVPATSLFRRFHGHATGNEFGAGGRKLKRWRGRKSSAFLAALVA